MQQELKGYLDAMFKGQHMREMLNALRDEHDLCAFDDLYAAHNGRAELHTAWQKGVNKAYAHYLCAANAGEIDKSTVKYIKDTVLLMFEADNLICIGHGAMHVWGNDGIDTEAGEILEVIIKRLLVLNKMWQNGVSIATIGKLAYG